MMFKTEWTTFSNCLLCGMKILSAKSVTCFSHTCLFFCKITRMLMWRLKLGTLSFHCPSGGISAELCFWAASLLYHVCRNNTQNRHFSHSQVELDSRYATSCKTVLQKHLNNQSIFMILQPIFSASVVYCNKNKPNTAREFSKRYWRPERLVSVLWNCIVSTVNTWQLSSLFSLHLWCTAIIQCVIQLLRTAESFQHADIWSALHSEK